MSQHPNVHFVSGHGGTQIAVHRLGHGPAVVMLHGLASNAQTNWIRYGHAAKVAAAGFEAVMLDLRCHGRSDAPRSPSAYPPDVALLDIEAVLAELDLGDFDLVGYSLGTRLSVQLVARGLAPKRIVLGGMGFESLTHWQPRRDHFLKMLGRFEVSKVGDSDFLAIQFMKSTKVDPEALRLLLESTGDIDPRMLGQVTMPALVLCGEDDNEIGSPELLAEHLPDARLQLVPGNHMNSVTMPALGEALAAWLAA